MFTIEELITEVRRLASEYPNAVYQNDTCFYTKGPVENGPGEGCIFGQAIRKLQPDLDLHQFEGSEEDTNFCHAIDKVLEMTIDPEPSEETSWCLDVQYYQDSKQSWGEAVKKASENYPLAASKLFG